MVERGRDPHSVGEKGLWPDVILELKPTPPVGAEVVWEWHAWDHLIQDFDPDKANYGVVAEHPELFDINYCPPGGKAACRNTELLKGKPGEKAGPFSNPSGLSVFSSPGKTGEKDWIHANSVSYDPVRDQIAVSFVRH